MATFTLTIPNAHAQRIAVALGKAQGLKDANDQPRAATAAEVKDFIIAQLRSVVNNVEGRELQEAALAAVVVPDVDIT